jgi:HlyD family secretion protein
MPARIKVGALPDAAVDGRVYKIAPKSKTAEGATLFDVEIELLPGRGRHPPRGVLRQRRYRGPREEGRAPPPERLVTLEGGKSTVEVPGTAEEPVKREIKVGLSDGINVEVASGLKESELVVERPPKKIE